MAIVTLTEAKEQIAFTPDLGSIDDALLTRKIAAAENMVNRMLGFTIAEAIDDERAGFEDGCPPALAEAILQLVAHLYAHRGEASAEALREPPFGVSEIVASFRDWTF